MLKLFLIGLALILQGQPTFASGIEEIDAIQRNDVPANPGEASSGTFIKVLSSGTLLSFGSQGLPNYVHDLDGELIPYDRPVIRRSTDHGKSWNPVYLGTLGLELIKAAVSKSGTIVVSQRKSKSDEPMVLVGKNDGTSWTEQSLNLSPEFCSSGKIETPVVRAERILLNGLCQPAMLNPSPNYFDNVTLESVDQGITWSLVSKYGTPFQGITSNSGLAINSRGDYFGIDNLAHIMTAFSNRPEKWIPINSHSGNLCKNQQCRTNGIFIDHKDNLIAYYSESDFLPHRTAHVDVSHDDGKNWKKHGSEFLLESPRQGYLTYDIAQIIESSSGTIYALVQTQERMQEEIADKDPNWSAIYSSDNGGESWKIVTSLRDENFEGSLRLHSIEISAENEIFAVGSLDRGGFDRQMKTFRILQ